MYAVKGTPTGQNTFDLGDWQTGQGGEWQHWYVANGNFNEVAGTGLDCDTLASISFANESGINVYPSVAK